LQYISSGMKYKQKDPKSQIYLVQILFDFLDPFAYISFQNKVVKIEILRKIGKEK
jgi:hypothetical protein